MNFLFDLFKLLIITMFPLLLWKSFTGIIKNKDYIFYMFVFVSIIILLLLNNTRYLLLFNSYLLIFILKDKRIYFLMTSFIVLLIHFDIFLLIEYLLLFVLFFIKDNKFNIYMFLSIYFYSLISFISFIPLLEIVFVIIIFYLLEFYIYKILLRDISFDIENRYNRYLFNFIHEVKNPLSVVLGYLEIIKKKEVNDLSKYLLIIDKEVNDSVGIIEEYLMYGRFSVNFDYIDVNLLLKEVYSDFKKLESLYDLDLNFYYDEEELIVFGDYSKLKQVFVNVIKNGIEAHGDKKLVIDIDYKIIKNNLVIDINDNGKGIVDSNLIGKEYYSSKSNGNGIGVFFSKKILNIHNGDIKYISNKNNGCDVRINLPLVSI